VLADAAHGGPVPVGHGCGGGRLAAGCPAWPLPQCPHARPRSRVSAAPRACGLPVSGSHLRRPCVRKAEIRRRRRPGPRDQRGRPSATCAAAAAVPEWGGCGSAAVLPQPASAAAAWVAAEPDAADTVAVRCCSATAVAVRRAGVRTDGACCGHCRSLRASAATGTGRPAGAWTAAATAGTRGRAGGRVGRRAGHAHTSWPAAQRPGPPRR
jgi:hypothetical protein